MTRSIMASQCHTLALSSRRNAIQACCLFRNFSTSNRRAEDEMPTSVSPRTQLRRDAAEAIKNLARRRPDSTRPAGQWRTSTGELSQKTFSKVPSQAIPSQRSTNRPWRSQNATTSNLPSSTETSFRRPPSRDEYGNRPARPPRSDTRDARPRQGDRLEKYRQNARFEESWENDAEASEDDMTEEEYEEHLKACGYVEPFLIKPAQGPHLDMASMMLEYAPKHFGATEPVSGEYPAMTDIKRRGLLQDIVRQVRKNETYTERDIDQMAKKLGPLMPRA